MQEQKTLGLHQLKVFLIRVIQGAVIGAGANVGEATGDIAVVGQSVKLPAGTLVRAGEQREE